MQSNHPMSRGKRWFMNLTGLCISASMLLSAIAAAPLPSSPAGGTTAQTAAAQVNEADRVNFRQIIYKLKAGSEISAFAANPALQGLESKTLFSSAGDVLSRMPVTAQAENGYRPRLDLYYHIQLGQEATFEDAQKVLDALKNDPSVELAYMEPLYRPATNKLLATDDFTNQQGYLLDESGNGVDAFYAWDVSGGRGGGVQLIDVEGGWQIGHEDLNIPSSSLIESVNSSDQAWIDHGTAVLGVIAGLNNGYGVTGIAPDVYPRMVSTLSFLTPDAILKAAANLLPGDIIVLPIQALGPATSSTSTCVNADYIPVEYSPANFDAIYAATQLGIIVVEAAGDGDVDLDNARYGGRFNRSNRNSGALLVGAGDSGSRDLEPCTNWGKRIDLQGWGDGVVSTGYGDLFYGTNPDDSPDPRQTYTATFGGTSAATSMVAGVVASLQGVAKARNYTLTPDVVRSILRGTGLPQADNPDGKVIGPLPNLRNAISQRLPQGVLLVSPENPSNLFTLRPTMVWQSYLGATQYELQIASNSTFTSPAYDVFLTGTEFTVTSNLANGTTYYWRVRAYVNDTWPNWPTDYFQFKVAGRSAPEVTLNKPDNGALTGNFAQVLSWKKSSPVPAGYQVQVSTDPTFAGANPESVYDGTALTFDSSLEANTRYYWHVRSIVLDQYDNESYGPWSGRRVLYTTLDASGLAPTLSDGGDTLRPTFSWEDITDARAYQIQASVFANYSTKIFDATVGIPTGAVIPDHFYKSTVNLPRGKAINWQVRAKGAYGWSGWVDGDVFTSAAPPATPSVIGPANLASAGDWEKGINFRWYRPKTLPEPTGYALQLSTTKDFSENVKDFDAPYDSSLAVNEFKVDGSEFDPETTYYWHVRSAGGDGMSNWSPTRVLYTTPPVPGVPLTVEANDTLRPTLSWGKVDIARSYQVQIARSDSFSGTALIATITTRLSPPLAITATLPRNATLRWRVRAGGLHGYSAWTDSEEVTTPNAPAAPVINYPANNAYVNTFGPTLDWFNSVAIKNVPGVTAYQIQISDQTDFANTADVIWKAESGVSNYIVPNTWNDAEGKFDALSKGGRYYWRVRAFNGEGYSLWTPTYSFITPAQVSGTVMDALNGGAPMSGVAIQVANRSLQSVTNADGVYYLRGLMPGDYSLTASTPGFARQNLSLPLGYGSNNTRNFNMVSFPDDGQIRVVLYWNGSPADLDAHMWIPTIDHKAHIYKDNLGDMAADGAAMDLANANGFGPEVITIGNLYNGVYTFAAYFSGSVNALANSGARFLVYDGSTLKGTILIPKTGEGHWWKAFTIDGKTRLVNSQNYNYITDSDPSPAEYSLP